MNKELYIQKEKSLKELQELSFLVHSLQSFLIENEKKFKREKSIDALNKIKQYFELKEKEYHKSENKQKEILRKLYSTCTHETAIKRRNISNYQCLICGCSLGKARDDIPEDCLISIDTTKDYKAAYIIEGIFKEIVYSDKDLIETINDAVLEMQYDRDIKVYRRLR